jgi:hypothetical protein
MTKIILITDGCEFSASVENDGITADELVDMFGGLMVAATYAHATVCSLLNTETFHEPTESDEE